MSDLENETFDMDLPAEGVEILDNEISFGTNDAIVDDADTVVLRDADTVMNVAAPAIAVGTVAPLAAAIVRETERVEVVEESVPAPVTVFSEPEPVVAPIVEPVHHVRWPWALLALPLLAIPFLNRTPETPVAEPVVVQTPVVREQVVAEKPVVKVETPKVETPKVVVAEKPKAEIPTCDGEFVAKDAAVMRETASDTGKVIQTVAANTVINIDEGEDAGYYKVTVGTDKGYLPVPMVVCQVAQATATVTG